MDKMVDKKIGEIPLLSIVIRTWNRLEYTIRTIVSIYENSGLSADEYEIICVDQGSTDGTVEWLKSVEKDGFYPIVPVFIGKNVGDGAGMQIGLENSKGEFFAQHDNDIELVSNNYFADLIRTYIILEKTEGFKPCALAGSHVQGIRRGTAPWNFAIKRYPNNQISIAMDKNLFFQAWVTASFIFRKEFGVKAFGSGMCNSWCGHWWDQGYDNLICDWIKYWHIDSTPKGGEYVQTQAKKFPSYSYVKRHYSNFI